MKWAKTYLHHYADFGLTFVKLGEEGRVDLECFNLEGSAGSKFRQVIRRLERDGGVFRMLPAADVPSVMDQLRAVSDDWLEKQSGKRESSFLSDFSTRITSHDFLSP